MFLNNKYKRLYYKIIDKARKRGVIEGYFEKHHIIPRSLGGKHVWWNVVNLTFREHYIVHWLLIKMLRGSPRIKMLWAFSLMTEFKTHGRIPPSWLYIKAKEAKREAMWGASIPEETRKKISQKALGRRLSEGHKRKLSIAGKGRKQSEEHKQRASTAKKGIKPTAEAYASIIECQHKRRNKERLAACGNIDWRICRQCKQWDSKENLCYVKNSRQYIHQGCKSAFSKALYQKTKLRKGILDIHSEEHMKNQSNR